MTIKRLFALVGIISLASGASGWADSDTTATTARFKVAAAAIEKEKDRLAVQAAFVHLSEAPQLGEFFEKCYGCAIFPTIGKGGFGVGVAHGKGWVFKEDALAGVSKMTQVTVGFQAGGQAFMQIVFFEDEEAYARFTTGTYEFSAQASATAITEGVNASTSTVGGSNAGAGNAQAKSRYTDGLAVFTKAKGGLMYEAVLGGQRFIFRSCE